MSLVTPELALFVSLASFLPALAVLLWPVSKAPAPAAMLPAPHAAKRVAPVGDNPGEIGERTSLAVAGAFVALAVILDGLDAADPS